VNRNENFLSNCRKFFRSFKCSFVKNDIVLKKKLFTQIVLKKGNLISKKNWTKEEWMRRHFPTRKMIQKIIKRLSNGHSSNTRQIQELKVKLLNLTFAVVHNVGKCHFFKFYRCLVVLPVFKKSIGKFCIS
jgi:hypothetical protein